MALLVRMFVKTVEKERLSTRFRKSEKKSLHISTVLSPVPPPLHYRRKNAPDVKYLPSSLTIQFMFDDFVKKNPDVTISVESYRQILKTMNISLKMLVSDACPTYERYSERNNDDDVNV